MDILFERSPSPLFLIDAETHQFVAANEATSKLLGYAREEFADLNLDDIRRSGSQFSPLPLDIPSALATYISIDDSEQLLEEQSQAVFYENRDCLLIALHSNAPQSLEFSQLAEDNARLQLLSRTVNDMVVVIGADGKISYANSMVETVLNFAPKDCKGQFASDFVNEDDKAKLSEAVTNAMRGGSAKLVFRHRHADASWRWLSATIYDYTSEPLINGFLLVAQDITHRHQIEEELRLRNDAMNAADNGIMIADIRLPGEPIVYVNPAFERITGYLAQEVIGQNARFLQGTETAQPARRILRKAINEGVPSSVVLLNYRKDGTPYWNELHIAPIRNEDKVVTHYVGIQNDVTYRTVIEQALRESQERFDEIVSSVNDIVYSVSLDASKALYISPAIREVLGFTTEDMYTGHRKWRDLVHPDDLHFAESSWTELNREGRIEREIRYVDAEGGTHTIYERAVVVRDSAGQALRIDGIASDISEQKLLRQNIVQAERLSALGELVAGVAHEINNPLTIISGHAQILEMTQDGPIKQDATTILRMAKRASEIVRNLLTFARRSEGDMQVGSVTKVVIDALDLVTYRLATHGVNLESHFDDADCVVLMNPTEIQQVVFNLISNADHAVGSRAPNDRQLKVSTHSSRDESGKVWMVIAIADNGYGMPAELITRIFDPFFTTKGVGHGTGLGLSICHGIVQTHGGKIKVKSVEGQGTTMEVWLPVASLPSMV